MVPVDAARAARTCSRQVTAGHIAMRARLRRPSAQLKPERILIMTTFKAVLLTSAALAGIATSAAAQTPAVRNVVLVHGAFADGSGWRGVYDDLTRRGYRVSVVQNPLTSLADDVAATTRVLDRQDGPAVLVGHSWGGTVITEAGVHPKVAALVYVSAFAPDAGETTSQQYVGFAATPEFVIETNASGFGSLSPAKFKAGFAHDVSDVDAAFMRDSQVPINMSAFASTLTNAAWRTRPSWAVIATEDKAFDQAMLLHMAKRIGAQITTVRGSHALFITQAAVIAGTIEQAARVGAKAVTKR
jgi:pimeloyl-ACP methyl ester carboxylesterase